MDSNANESLDDVELPLCRICSDREESNVTGPLIVSCRCAGSLKFIHTACLETWITSRPSHPYTAAEIRRIDSNRIEPNSEAAPADSVPVNNTTCVESMGLGAARLNPPVYDRRYRCEICGDRYAVLLEEQFVCDGARVFGHASLCHVIELALLFAAFYFFLVTAAPAIGDGLNALKLLTTTGSWLVRSLLWLCAGLAMVISVFTLRRVAMSWRGANSIVSIVPDSAARV